MKNRFYQTIVPEQQAAEMNDRGSYVKLGIFQYVILHLRRTWETRGLSQDAVNRLEVYRDTFQITLGV